MTKIPSSAQCPEMDMVIGKKIKALRQAHNMSQTKLGNEVGVAWQQIQKYESGKNRVAATMLWKIASVFNVGMSHFFGDEDRTEKGKSDSSLSRAHTDKVIQYYSRLSAADRDVVFQFLVSLAESAKSPQTTE